MYKKQRGAWKSEDVRTWNGLSIVLGASSDCVVGVSAHAQALSHLDVARLVCYVHGRRLRFLGRLARWWSAGVVSLGSEVWVGGRRLVPFKPAYKRTSAPVLKYGILLKPVFLHRQDNAKNINTRTV